MRRAVPVLLLLVTACAAQPPERAPLPDLADVLPEPLGCQLTVGEPMGVDVLTVSASGAAGGILQEGDVISAIDGTPTTTRPELTEIMNGYSPGDTVEVTYLREGAEGTVEITLEANAADESRAMIGITVQTSFQTQDIEAADDTVAPSPTARPIQVGDSLYLFDPLAGTWQQTGITPPAETRWVSTSSGLYSVTDAEPVEVIDLNSGEPVPADGFRGWEPQRLVGAVDDMVLMVVTTDIAEQPGFVNLALAGFDPRQGETVWVSPVASTFGIPVSAFGSPDGSAFVAVGARPESGEQQNVAFFDANGAPQTSDELTGLGSPMGWFDSTSMAFRTGDEVISVFSFLDGSTITYDLPDHLLGAVTASVGDGRHILVVSGRDLHLQDLTDLDVSLPLSTGCNVGQIGDPGWGI